MAASSSFSARALQASGMHSGREDTDSVRHQDRATNFGQVAGGFINAFAAAIFIQRATCTLVWDCLQVGERQHLISISRMADSSCLTHIRAFSAPVIPPLQPSLGFVGVRRFPLGRFARGVRVQRAKDAWALEPVFSGDASAAVASAEDTAPVGRSLPEIVADLAQHVVRQERRIQALERQVRHSG